METNKNMALGMYAVLIGGGILFLLVYLYYYSPETVQGIIPANVAATTSPATNTVVVATTTNLNTDIVYKNEKYGFSLLLGKDWENFQNVDSEVQFGRMVKLSKNLSATATPVAFIPILVYPIEKWREWEGNNFDGYPTAAPMGPTERGRNGMYVFATAPRYNYSFLSGFEEVEEIIKNLKTF